MSTKTTYKQTELGLIPDDWEVKKLGELGFFFKGKGVPKTSIETEGKYKCLTYGDLYTKYDYVIKNVKSFINDASDSQEINFGDICIAGSGETIEDIGKCAVFIDDKTGYAGGDIIIFRSDENPLTLSYILNSDLCKRQKYRLGQGHSVVHIYSSQLQNLKIPLPPLPEQKKIADCLSTWDVAIEKQSALINALTERKKALMQQLLTGKKRLPGFSEDWKEVKLGEISLKKSSTLQANSIEENKGIYNVYGANGIIANIDFFSENEKYIGIVKDGSGVGNLMLCDANSSVLGTLDIIKNNHKTNLIFLFLILSKINFKKFTVGGAIPHIYYKDYSKEKIHIPSLSEQTAIAEILETADRELQLQKEKLAQLQIQKKGLMQVLLTGKKRLIN